MADDDRPELHIVGNERGGLPHPPDTSDMYFPTPAEKRLLDALSDPENRLLDTKSLCRTAGVHRDTYYHSMKKPGFRALLHKLSVELIRASAVPLINVGIQFAREGSVQHWKALMEMSGLLSHTTEEGEGGRGATITVRFEDPRAKVIDVTPDK